MEKPRSLRWARVEYQPNLENPVKPVALGIVAEELRRRGNSVERYLIVLGREPKGNVSGLQLEDTWGPFRKVVTEWMEAFSKTAREVVEAAPADEHSLDELARRWSWNVYLREPESYDELGATVSIDQYALRFYEEYIGDPFVLPPSSRRSAPSKAERARLEPWILNSKSSRLEAATV
jgi:hypothetical protein